MSSDHMITTPHWIASSYSGLFSTIANWMLFLQLVRWLSLHSFTWSPTMSGELNVIHVDCAGKPRQPTPTGNSQVCHPRSLQICV